MRWLRLGVSVIGQLVSWGSFLAYLFGIPSPMQGKFPQGAVAFMTSNSAVIALCVVGIIVTGPLLWTSGWWWPYVAPLIKRMRSHRETKEPSADAFELSPLRVPRADPAQVEKFKGLESLITRHRKANRPIRNLITASIWNLDTLSFGADREELVAHLGALKVVYPPDDAGRKKWFRYLVHLEASCQTGDLQEARSIHEEDDTKQPTTDV